ncbi:MAG: non-ribosomal peptide synthetase [Candidatus Omnitrophota bacterium]
MDILQFNDTTVDYPKHQTVYRLFEAQVERTPEQTAAIFKDRSFTYRQVNELSNRLARYLRTGGVGPDQIVGIMADRSPEMLIGIFAILKAGGAYMPVSPATPGKRVSHLLKESGTRLFLTQGKLLPGLEAHTDPQANVRILNIDLFPAGIASEELSEIYHQSGDNLPEINQPGDLVYVIYTSGSTGKPKGVCIAHHALVNRLHWMQRQYPLTNADTILQKTPFFFDVSTWEMFWWAMVGARVCFLMPNGERFPQAIIETTEKQNVTVMHFVPSMMSVFLEYLRNSTEDIQRLRSLTHVFASGEKLTSAHVQAFNEILTRTNGTRLINLYGPTEATVDVTYFDCLPYNDAVVQLNHEGIIEKIPIGKPIDNTQLYILSEKSELCEVGETGELCIGGVGVARGYLNHPETTDQKFNSFIPGLKETVYRTGDLARWLPDGNVEFLGRSDFQVKIHGLRIELGEIEAVLSANPSILDNVVVVKQYAKNITTIVAYIVFKSGMNVDVKELKRYLKDLLPEYMVPTLFVFMERFPLNPSGKVDRNALPEPAFS